MKKTKIEASAFLLFIIIALFAAGSAFVFVSLRSDPLEEALSDDRVINTVFILEHERKPLATHVLMYYPATKRAAVFDIPGDLGLIVRQINRVDRIDTVYSPEKPQIFEDEIGRLLGLDIHYSVIFTMENLAKTVDLIAGVECFIPQEIARYQPPLVFFPSGFTRLDGKKAVQYLLFEDTDQETEPGRSRRERFFTGLIKTLGEKNAFLKNPQVDKIYLPLVKTNMNHRTRIRFFDELAGIDTDRMTMQIVGGNRREVSGQSLLFPYYDGSLIKEIVRETLGALTRQTSSNAGDRLFTVEVLNATTVAGLAGRTAELLRGFGYDVINVGNADRNDYERTEIVARFGTPEEARALADIIRCKNIRMETLDAPQGEAARFGMEARDFELKADFTLVIGRDFNGRYTTE
jgi:anionic cell wall polymer biosynthesis LytR-Cps2A-Psr (LCP) family protein